MGSVDYTLSIKSFHNGTKQIIMLTDIKNQSEILSFWLSLFFILLVLRIYGKQFIEWLLMKLYGYFINKI